MTGQLKLNHISIGNKICTTTNTDILVSPGSGSGCSGHGRHSPDESLQETSVSSVHEEVGEIISINQSLGIGLALMRLTSLYPSLENSIIKKFFYINSNDGESTSSDKIVRIQIFQPTYWPKNIDHQTGKIKVA